MCLGRVPLPVMLAQRSPPKNSEPGRACNRHTKQLQSVTQLPNFLARGAANF